MIGRDQNEKLRPSSEMHKKIIKFQEENPNLELEKGDHVKLPFPFESHPECDQYEWMWAIVVECDNIRRQGIALLQNDPTRAKWLKNGDAGGFDYEVVCEVIRKND